MEIIKLTKAQEIATYRPSKALKRVLDMSRSLGRPLLLTGQPGTGKTQFAEWYVKNTQDFNKEIFQFNTKSTSLYTDLFYEYDAVSHFRDKEGKKPITEFITLTALGKAIVCAKGIGTFNNDILKTIAENSGLTQDNALKSVVLVDEIDKAPRDFPNDLLHEIENLCFTIRQTTPPIEVKLTDEQKQHVVIIMTSNNEKNLPDAFLRRCLFYYIDFPNKDKITEIILTKLNADALDGLADKMDFFVSVMSDNNDIDKKPSTSEWIDWVNFLRHSGLLEIKIFNSENAVISIEDKEKILESFAALFKKQDDVNKAEMLLPPLKTETTEANTTAQSANV